MTISCWVASEGASRLGRVTSASRGSPCFLSSLVLPSRLRLPGYLAFPWLLHFGRLRRLDRLTIAVIGALEVRTAAATATRAPVSALLAVFAAKAVVVNAVEALIARASTVTGRRHPG